MRIEHASCYSWAVSASLYQPFPMAGNARGQIWRHQPATRRPRHFHSEPELNLVTAGRGAFGYGQRMVEVGAGDLVHWTPGQDHELLSASEDFDLFVIALAPDFSERVLGEVNHRTQRGPLLHHLSPEQLAPLALRCQFPSIHADSVAKETTVGDLWRQAHAYRDNGAPEHSLTRRVLGFVKDDPSISRGEIAARTHASPGEVSRHFHHDMALPLSAYRSRLRLLRFIDRVDAGDSLLTAALSAGFGSYSQCHRVFQAAMACSPREYFSTCIRRAIENAYAPLGQRG